MREMLLTALYLDNAVSYSIEERLLDFCIAKYKTIGLDEVLDSITLNYFMGFITRRELVCQTLDAYIQKYGAVTLPTINY